MEADGRTAFVIVVPEGVGAVGFVNHLIALKGVIGRHGSYGFLGADSIGVVGVGHACAAGSRQTRKLSAVLSGESRTVVID